MIDPTMICMQTVASKRILEDLKELRDRLDSLIETLEIMSDEELMESLRRSETQPEKREFREFLKELDIDA